MQKAIIIGATSGIGQEVARILVQQGWHIGIAHASRALERLFRNSDYLGSINDGFLYVLLANTSPKDAGYVTQRIAEAGYSYRLVTDIKD